MKDHRTRLLSIGKRGPQACERCGDVAPLRSLDVFVPAIPKRSYAPATSEGWCPLIALCAACWTWLREAAIEP